MEQMRSEFEAAFKEKFHLAEEHLAEGPYGSDTAQVAWWAWQESRRAIAVNLGKPIYVKHDGDYIHAWPAYNVDIAIRAAGLRVKEK